MLNTCSIFTKSPQNEVLYKNLIIWVSMGIDPIYTVLPYCVMVRLGIYIQLQNVHRSPVGRKLKLKMFFNGAIPIYTILLYCVIHIMCHNSSLYGTLIGYCSL